MGINNFNYYLLYYLGINSSLNESILHKIASNVINFVFSFHLLFLEIIPTAWYIQDHFDNLIDVLIALYQIPCFGNGLFAYLNFIINKYSANEVFHEIEMIVRKRMNPLTDELYRNAIKQSEIYAKYPTIFINGYFTLNALVAVKDIISDLVKGEMHPEKWFLPLRNK